MATTVSFNGSNFSIPAVGERNYGQNLTNYFIAIAAGALTKAGGNATLTADLNLGANFGLVAKYLKSSSINIAQSGVIRFANNEGIAWRNTANGSDITLKVNASDALEFNGTVLPTQSVVDAALLLKLDKLNGVATNLTLDTYLDFTQVASLTSPSAGKIRVGAKSDGKLYQRDSSGLEKLLGGGAGAGEKNYSIDGSNDSTGWTASGAGITVTTDSTPANFPDNSTQTTALKITRVSGTDYVYKRFTLDSVDYNKKLKILKDIKYAGAAGDYSVRVFSNTASNYAGTSTEIPVGPTGSLPGNTTQQVTMTFDSSGATAPYIEVRIYGNAGTTPIYINNFLVGPGVVGQVPAIGSISYSPLVTGFGTALYGLEARRIGDKLHISGRFQAGTPTAIEARLSLPANLTVGQFAGINNVVSVGKYARGSATGNMIKQGVLLGTTGLTYLTFGVDDYTSAASPLANRNGNDIVITNEVVSIDGELVIPIAEWAGSGTVNLGAGAQPEFVSNAGTWDSTNTTTFASGPNGSPISGSLTAARSKTVQFATPYQQGDILTIEYRMAGTNVWVDEAKSVYPNSITTGFTWGAYFSNISSTGAVVSFGQFAIQGTTYNSNTGAINWNAATYDAWRVRKVSASSPVGFGLATATDSGLVSSQESGSFVAATTGPVNQNITISYSRVGKQVTLQIDNVSFVSAASVGIAAAAGTIPASLRTAGANALILPMGVHQQGGANTDLYYFGVNSDGSFSIQRGVGQAGWTSGATFVLRKGAISYMAGT